MISPRNRVLIIALLAIFFLAAGFWALSSEGFCYERHNGTYCYKGATLIVMVMCLFTTSISLTIGAIEAFKNKTIKILNANLSLNIFYFSILFMFVSMFMSGPNT
jgi:hypothetical protein